MIFDYLLMFTDEATSFSSQTSGVIGRILDLRAAGQGKGKSARVAFAFKQSVSAGAGVSFTLETADNENFTSSKKIPLSIPPLSKNDMTEGAIFSAPLPVVGMERYCRLNVSATTAVNLTGLLSGIVLDADEK